MMVHVPGLSGLRSLADLASVSLDLETTGLNVQNDRIIQIGIVGLDGGRIVEKFKYDRLIDPQIEIPETASRITGITNEMVRDAPGLESVFSALMAMIHDRVLIGHHIAFDRAILRAEAKRFGLPWVDPPSIDVGHLMGALDPTQPDLGFDSIATELDVSVEGRHTAYGDARMVAEMYTKLLPRLYDAGVRTYAEAKAFAARRTDLREAEVNAGWTDRGELDIPPPPPRSRYIDGVIFARP